MPINEKLIIQEAAAATGDADAAEGLVLHLDANDEDSIESGGANTGAGSGTWFDIANHDLNVPLIDKGSNLVLHLNASDTTSYSGSGTTWTDLSTYGNNGTINNATFASDTRGYFDFEESNGDENVEITDSSSLDITTNITLEAWINEESVDNYHRLFWKNGAYALYRGTNGWNFLTGSDILVHNSDIPSTSTWYHIAATYDGAYKKLYINGTLVDTDSETASIPTNNNSLFIGGDGTAARFFDGKVSSVRIYNVALTGSEVAQNYRAGNTFSYSSIYSTDLITNLDAANYTSGTWDDSVGSHNATIYGASFDKELGNYFDFDGSNDYMQIAASTDFNIGNTKTFEIWHWLDITSDETLLYQGNSTYTSSTLQYHFRINAGNYQMLCYNSSGSFILTGTSSNYFSATTNSWHHIAITFAGATSGSAVKIYLDGIEMKSTTLSANANSGSHPVSIGRREYSSAYSYYNGKMGAIKFHSEVLTPAQVAQNYLAKKNDYPNGFNATISGADFDTNSSSPNENYFDFSGATSDLITIPDNDLFDFTANTSMEVWLTKGTTNHHIINKKDGASQESWAFWTNGSAFYFYPYNTSNVAPNIVTSSTLNATWNHVTITVGSSLDFELYLNGSSDATGTVSGTMKTDTATVKIGSYNGGIAYAGKIAMVKFYAKELSASEVTANYNATKATFGIS